MNGNSTDAEMRYEILFVQGKRIKPEVLQGRDHPYILDKRRKQAVESDILPFYHTLFLFIFIFIFIFVFLCFCAIWIA